MLSKLKLLLLENSELDFVMERINENDKLKLLAWYSKSITHNKNIDIVEILKIFLWCYTEGRRIEERENPEMFGRCFEEKSNEFQLSKNDLANLFFSHYSLYNDDTNFEINNENNQSENVRGKFIVFEGLDGSGKSTQIAKLVSKLRAIGKHVHETAEPTNSGTGGLIRDTLSNNYQRDPYELASLFLADRISHNVNPMYGINKYLDEGINVICDRYYYSSFAYQGISADIDYVMDINLTCKKITKPDLCIFLDLDVDDCIERVHKEREHYEIFETDAKIMSKIRKQFLDVFKKLNETENIFIVDSNRAVSSVSEEIFSQVLKLFY